jgi:TrwC relaxase
LNGRAAWLQKDVGVLSLGKLSAGHQDYYEREVASGAEDYYAMRGEAAGEWLGSGAAGLGLGGRRARRTSCSQD